MKKLLVFFIFFTSLNAEVVSEDIKNWDFDNGYFLLDVRTAPECKKSGIIKGAIAIPIFNIDGSYNSDFLKEVEKRFKKTDKIAIVCRSGARSMMAARMLEKAGFKQLTSLAGGMIGLPEDSVKLVPYKSK